jgi:hypothetical protein
MKNDEKMKLNFFQFSQKIFWEKEKNVGRFGCKKNKS